MCWYQTCVNVSRERGSEELHTGSQQKSSSSSAYYRHVLSPYIVLSDYCADLNHKLPQYPQTLPNCLSYLLISHNLHFILSWLSFSDVLITNLWLLFCWVINTAWQQHFSLNHQRLVWMRTQFYFATMQREAEMLEKWFKKWHRLVSITNIRHDLRVSWSGEWCNNY